jgi:hypothetical protein
MRDTCLCISNTHYLQVWQCLLSLELPRESHSILTDWHNIIGDLVKERIHCVVGLSMV